VNDRRPLTKAESRESRPIRLKPSEVEELKAEAAARGIGWTTFARECLLTGLSVEQARASRLAHTRITA
jgi:predicted DNA binding CopG/RHH family protein